MQLIRYRFIYREEPAGPWRSTRAEAQEDAIKAGEADRDEHDEKRVYFRPWAEIEISDGD